MDFEKLVNIYEEMLLNYEQRKVETTRINNAIIDTSMIMDSSSPYETGICHPDYNQGDWVIVELYDTKELAKIGHKKWVKLFSLEQLPTYLIDANRCIINDITEVITGQNLNRIYKKNNENQNP